MLGIEINGKDRFFNQLDILPSLLSEAAYNSMYELAETTRGNAESILQSSMKHSSGELAGSLKMEVEQDSNGNVDAKVWSDKAGALYREMGTGPVGQASEKDLPEGINPVYTQEPWFFPVSYSDNDLNKLYGIPIVEIQNMKFYYTHGQPARPFMYPAFKQAIENVDEIAKRNVKLTLEKGL